MRFIKTTPEGFELAKKFASSEILSEEGRVMGDKRVGQFYFRLELRGREDIGLVFFTWGTDESYELRRRVQPVMDEALDRLTKGLVQELDRAGIAWEDIG